MFDWIKSKLRLTQPSAAEEDWQFELEEGGFYGRVRQGGALGQRMPDLIAHRPENWRFARLSDLVSSARRAAEKDFGQERSLLLVDAIKSICDAKGDFTVTWRSDCHLKDYEKIIDRALLALGEEEILHELAES